MLRVFLTEDETIIRETLRDTVPWAQCGYTFAGEAADGEMALPLIQKCALPISSIKGIRMCSLPTSGCPLWTAWL